MRRTISALLFVTLFGVTQCKPTSAAAPEAPKPSFKEGGDKDKNKKDGKDGKKEDAATKKDGKPGASGASGTAGATGDAAKPPAATAANKKGPAGPDPAKAIPILKDQKEDGLKGTCPDPDTVFPPPSSSSGDAPPDLEPTAAATSTDDELPPPSSDELDSPPPLEGFGLQDEDVPPPDSAGAPEAEAAAPKEAGAPVGAKELYDACKKGKTIPASVLAAVISGVCGEAAPTTLPEKLMPNAAELDPRYEGVADWAPLCDCNKIRVGVPASAATDATKSARREFRLYTFVTRSAADTFTVDACKLPP